MMSNGQPTALHMAAAADSTENVPVFNTMS